MSDQPPFVLGQRVAWRSRATDREHTGTIVIVLPGHPAGRDLCVEPDHRALR